MASWEGGATGAISGASAGSALGPIGAGVGGLIGGIAGLFGGGRKKKKRKKFSTLDERQQKLNEQQYQALTGQGPLADLFSYNPEQANSVFDQIVGRPAQRQFAEETVPSITGAFRKQGLQDSSYVGDALAKSGRDVQEQLNALRAQQLYGQEQQSQQAKRNAVENLQNRQTFAYGEPEGKEGFDISKVLGTITPDMISGVKDWWNKPEVNPSVSGIPAGISGFPGVNTPPRMSVGRGY